MNRSTTTTTAESRRPVIPSDLALREFPDLIPIHNSQLCGCAECSETAAAIAAWHVQGLLQIHSAESSVERARRERRERRERTQAHWAAVKDRSRHDAARVVLMKEARATMIGRPKPWGESLMNGVTRREILSWARPGQGWCEVPYRPGGMTLGWGPCGKARCPECIEWVMDREASELFYELNGRPAIVKRFASRAEAAAYRRGTSEREDIVLKGRRRTPGGRQFEVGHEGEVVLVFPAELRPDEPGARTGADLGRALLRAFLQRVEHVVTDEKERQADDLVATRPTLRRGVKADTVRIAAEAHGFTDAEVSTSGPCYEIEKQGRRTFMFFYNATPEDVDEIVTAANHMGPDVLGNLALARAAP